jgi:UDP-N-acetylmuramate dehydrogenase
MTIEENIPLAPLTTFKIGGPARFFVRAASLEDLKKSLDFARDKHLAVLVLGGGSNILVDDKGFDGLVIKIEIQGIEERNGEIVAGAGEEWDALVQFAIGKNLWGIENLSGIPGSVGGAPVQNIGAYGAEIKDTLTWVEVFDTSSDSLKQISHQECGFEYRSSSFRKNPGRCVITRVCLTLHKDGEPNLSYKDLRELQNPTLPEVREAVLKIRSKKFPDLAVEGTGGSFFLNPILPKTRADELVKKFPELPHFPAGDGVKISLAWLLDHALNLKGLAVLGARLFEHQPLVIAARRGTRASEVRALALQVKNRVKDELGIEIEPEVQMV